MLGKEVLNPGVALLVGAVLDSVIDVEINLLHLLIIARLERLALHNADNLLKRQAVAVKLAVKNSALGEAVNLGADVIQMRERLASAREESLVADCQTADAVQLPLSIAGKLDVLATLVVVMCQHRVRDRTSVHRLLGVLCRRWLGRLRRLDTLAVRLGGSLCGAWHLLNHAACLGLLRPVALCLIQRLLDWGRLILLPQILTHRNEASILLELTVHIAVGGDNRADSASGTCSLFNSDRPHLNLACRRLAIESGKRVRGHLL